MREKVLVVDDEQSIRNLLEEVLNDAGYDVLLAENGQLALDILEIQEIGVIFLDLRLFGMNGIELCRTIRKSSPVPLIYAITGWSGLFDIEEIREAGFDDYFTKPVSPETLTRAVADAFEKLNRWKRGFPV
jgi:CheY-like chemotaxis protein